MISISCPIFTLKSPLFQPETMFLHVKQFPTTKLYRSSDIPRHFHRNISNKIMPGAIFSVFFRHKRLCVTGIAGLGTLVGCFTAAVSQPLSFRYVLPPLQRHPESDPAGKYAKYKASCQSYLTQSDLLPSDDDAGLLHELPS